MKLSRLQADGLLLLATIIWGTTLVALKVGDNSLNPVLFSGMRFLVAAIVLAPFAWMEHKRSADKISRKAIGLYLLVGVCLTCGSVLQQLSLVYASVTDGGFITALYATMVPFVAWLINRTKIKPIILLAALTATCGAWLLNDTGQGMLSWSRGNLLMLAADVVWAFHVVLVGKAIHKLNRPVLLSIVQAGVAAITGLPFGLALGPLTHDGFAHALPALLYAGVISGCIAWTIQGVAQRLIPPAESAIIMSMECIFAAIAGAFLMGDRISTTGWAGCALILTSVLIAELSPYIKGRPA